MESIIILFDYSTIFIQVFFWVLYLHYKTIRRIQEKKTLE